MQYGGKQQRGGLVVTFPFRREKCVHAINAALKPVSSHEYHGTKPTGLFGI